MMVEKAEGSVQPLKQARRPLRWIKRLAVTSVLAGVAAGGWAFDDAAAPAGLKGIFPAEAPETLSAEAFESLGPTWQEWSKGAAEAIADFYKLDGDLAAQKAALSKLKTKLGVLNRAIADRQYSVIHDPLISIRGPLARRIGLAEAAMATLEADPAAARATAVKTSADKVAAALGALTADLQTVAGGPAWLPFIKAEALTTAWGASVENEATVAALKATRDQLAKRESLSDMAQKEFLSRPKFVEFQAAIDAHLSTLGQQAAPVDLNATRAGLTALAAAMDEYELADSTASAGELRAAVDKISQVAPDRGAAVKAFVDRNYMNYNLRIAASETFLNRLLADSRVEQGQVNDYILGAAVGGWQTTSTNVVVDTKASKDNILFDLVLSGTVQSNTAGRTDQATIYTSGYHTFRSVKGISYDGHTFTTSPAVTSVSANNTTTGASTRMSGMPLFGQVAQRVAMREASAREGQSEAIAAGRVSGKVTPRFNEEVDNAFGKAKTQIDTELENGLKETGLFPDLQSFSSTDTDILVSTRLAGAGKLGGYAGEPTLLAADGGATLLLHESVINNTIDQIGFDGKKMNEEELRHHIEQFLSKALSREFKFRAPEAAAKPEEGATAAEPAEPAEEKEPAQLVFVAQDAVRVQLRNGELLLIIRAGLERKDGEPIPAHEITVPLTFTVKGDKIEIRRDSLQVLPIEGESMPIQQRVMNTRISSALPDREVSGVFTIKGPNREVAATVSGIHIADGWIAVNAK